MGAETRASRPVARRRVRRLERRRRRGQRRRRLARPEVAAPQRFASIDPDEHIDYQSRRPQVELVDGVTPLDHLARERLLRGVVRRPRPRGAARRRAQRALEGLLQLGDDGRHRDRLHDGRHPRRAARRRAAHARGCASPAPRPTPSSSAPSGSSRSRYEGPTGIVGVLHDACRAAGIQSASLWAPVPHYVATPPNPPATRALLERLGTLAGLTLDLHGLDQLVDLWRAQVDHAIADNDEVQTYVRRLEGQVDAEDADRAGRDPRRAASDDDVRTPTSSSPRSSSSCASRAGSREPVPRAASPARGTTAPART